ncbi:MAG: hypothetical protein M0Z30_14885 [Actinomycetota bacterium]|nr:hypothetical protein [Actinomycetota bacterium]
MNEELHEAARRILESWADTPGPAAEAVSLDILSSQRATRKRQAVAGDFLARMAGGLPEHVILAGNVYDGAPTAFAIISPPDDPEDSGD